LISLGLYLFCLDAEICASYIDTKVLRITHSSNLLCASSASSFGSPTPSSPFFSFFFSLPALSTLLLYVPFAYPSTGIPGLFCIIIRKKGLAGGHVEKCT
jgi:hypothetical protein